MSRRNARHVAFVGLLTATVLAILAASVDAHAQEPVPTSAPGCIYFVPATLSSPPYCVPDHRQPGPLDGLDAVGYTGAGMTLGGIATTTIGIGIWYAGGKGREPDDDLMLAGGVTTGIGVLLIVVGAPLWVVGKDDDYATKVGVGPGSVNVAGTF